jgi:competence protein ComEC
LKAGERWRMTVRLKSPHGGSNPHGFDFELWLWEQGLQATGYVRAGPRDTMPQRLVSTWWHPVEQLRQRVRDAIFARLAGGVGGEEARERQRLAGVVAALVVGDQQAIDRADWDVFRATGVAHLMSISGLHVTMFAWVATWLLGWLWRRSPRLCLALPAQTAGLLGGVMLATVYAVFSGWGVPSQRTVWMLATVSVLRLSGKRWPWSLVWMLSCAVVVALDPWALMQAGFWLSFVAVGVLFATDAGLAQSAEKSIVARLHAFFREQWVITLALTPLTLLLFGQVSLIGLVANALTIPWVTLLVTPLSLIGVLWAPLWSAAAQAVQVLAWVLAQLAALPLATLSVAQAPLWAGAAGLLGGLLLAMRLPWSLRAIGLPLMLPVLLWLPARPAPGQFELLAADIGQGNAVLVQTATHALLYDAGPSYSRESDAGHRVLVPLLRALDVKLDRLVLSHRDNDHTGGAPAVLAMQPGADLLSSIENGHVLQALRPATRCESGQSWQWDGVRFDVLHPQAQDYDVAAKSNALSCVLRVTNGARTLLLTGDIEQRQEAQLLATCASLKSDVLLVPHHGSKTSSSAAFLGAVAPSIALVQAGYRNRFGHPAAPVMARYAERQVRVIDSASCGAALWQSVQPQQVSCQREQGRRYWQHRVP